MATKKKSKKPETITVTFCGKRRRLKLRRHIRGTISAAYESGDLSVFEYSDGGATAFLTFVHMDGIGDSAQAAVTSLEKEMRWMHRKLSKMLDDV